MNQLIQECKDAIHLCDEIINGNEVSQARKKLARTSRRIHVSYLSKLKELSM